MRLRWLAFPILASMAHGQQGDASRVRQIEREWQRVEAERLNKVLDDQPIAERLLLDYGGSARFVLMTFEDEFSTPYTLRRSEARLYLRAELDGAHRFFGRLKFQWDDWNNGRTINGRDKEWDAPFGDRWWYEFDWRGYQRASTGKDSDFNFNTRIGKQFVQWGEGVSLSHALEAALVEVEYKGFALRGLAGQTPTSDTVDWDGSRPRYDLNTTRNFYGAMIEARRNPEHQPYVYWLSQRDHNDRDFASFTLSPSPGTGPFTYDTSYLYHSQFLGVGSRGNLTRNVIYRIESVMEFGEGLTSSIGPDGLPRAQTREDISAWAGVAGFTYLLRDDKDSRIDVQAAVGSGDDDRLQGTDTFGGNLSGTDDTAYNSLGFVYTGLALSPALSNLVMLKVGGTQAPFRLDNEAGDLRKGRRAPEWQERLRVGAEGYLFHKLDRDAPNSMPTNSNGFIGGEIDLILDWNVFSDLSVNTRYGVFIPGPAIRGSEDELRHTFLLGVTYAF